VTVTHHGGYGVSMEMIDGCSEKDEVNLTQKTLGVKISVSQACRGESAVPGVTTATDEANVGNWGVK